MERRDFLRRMLMATTAAQFLDIDQLLWTPRPMITVPRMPLGVITCLNVMQFDDILTNISLQYMQSNDMWISDRVFPVTIIKR